MSDFEDKVIDYLDNLYRSKRRKIMARLPRIKDILDSWTPDVAREFVNSLPDDVSIDMKSNHEDLLSRYIDSKGDIAGVGVVYDWNAVQYGIIPDACLVPMPEWYDLRGFFSLVVGDDLSRGSRLFYMGKGRLLRMIDWMASRAELREAFMMGESFEEE